MLYADWTASGRCYAPIEDRLRDEIMPMIANTHTDHNASSSFTTRAYGRAKETIKRHVKASAEDVLIPVGSGMTGALNKLQRIMGLRVPEKLKAYFQLPEEKKPIVFVSHMEHHSNHTSWLETLCEVVVVPPNEHGKFSMTYFENALCAADPARPKIVAVTACSNVTGIENPVHDIAKLIHRYDGWCFVDYACSAPYVNMNMHPDDREAQLDAISFSPHKFLGGPGSTGILIFNKTLYQNEIPDVSGGGTVDWTNPWGGRKYMDDIEGREDGGTPPILQTIKAAMAIELKEEMGTDNIQAMKSQLMDILWTELAAFEGIDILAEDHRVRQGILSFRGKGIHYHEVVQQLNDTYGIQSRGGCSCAGTYGHYLLGVNQARSKHITDLIDAGDDSEKPGWVRISIHPTMLAEEVLYIASSIKKILRR